MGFYLEDHWILRVWFLSITLCIITCSGPLPSLHIAGDSPDSLQPPELLASEASPLHYHDHRVGHRAGPYSQEHQSCLQQPAQSLENRGSQLYNEVSKMPVWCYFTQSFTFKPLWWLVEGVLLNSLSILGETEAHSWCGLCTKPEYGRALCYTFLIRHTCLTAVMALKVCCMQERYSGTFENVLEMDILTKCTEPQTLNLGFSKPSRASSACQSSRNHLFCNSPTKSLQLSVLYK